MNTCEKIVRLALCIHDLKNARPGLCQTAAEAAKIANELMRAQNEFVALAPSMMALDTGVQEKLQKLLDEIDLVGGVLIKSVEESFVRQAKMLDGEAGLSPAVAALKADVEEQAKQTTEAAVEEAKKDLDEGKPGAVGKLKDKLCSVVEKFKVTASKVGGWAKAALWRLGRGAYNLGKGIVLAAYGTGCGFLNLVMVTIANVIDAFVAFANILRGVEPSPLGQGPVFRWVCNHALLGMHFNVKQLEKDLEAEIKKMADKIGKAMEPAPAPAPAPAQ